MSPLETDPPLRVIVADDHEDARKTLARVIQELQHTVVAVVESGNKLLDAIRELGPDEVDICCVDAYMPPLTEKSKFGGIVCAQQAFNWCDIPSIIITGQNQEEIASYLKKLDKKERAFLAAFFVKPVGIMALSVALENFERENQRKLLYRRHLGETNAAILEIASDFESTTSPIDFKQLLASVATDEEIPVHEVAAQALQLYREERATFSVFLEKFAAFRKKIREKKKE